MIQHRALGKIADDLPKTFERFDRERVVDRVWAKDYVLWSDEPTEIEERLGWLDLVEKSPKTDQELERLVEETRMEGIQDVVLLGMGGSSLGAEALRASFGQLEGWPKLHVLDSTHPRWVRRVRRMIHPEKTLFLVASKSGTTAEIQALYRYFRGEMVLGLGDAASRRFVAITDPHTPLVELASKESFRQVFLNPTDIGGRFSVLSRFGLVAAGLTGIDTQKLLQRAHAMAKRCQPGKPSEKNPGFELGAVLGLAARSGRHFLSLLLPERLATLGLWIEQLLAESTGKDGTGILPVISEPPWDPATYGDDRLFALLRFKGQRDAELEARAAALEEAGQPIFSIEIKDPYELGGELFRWQMATAVAGHVLGLHPFDQPDVEATKQETRKILTARAERRKLPPVETDDDFKAALAKNPRYVALMSYTDDTPEVAALLQEFRQRLKARGFLTTAGYGPRFLHSAGQFHKGGLPGGLFIQLTDAPGEELPIPGRAYGFATLIQAQADGDYLALTSKNRHVVRIKLGNDPEKGLGELLENLD